MQYWHELGPVNDYIAHDVRFNEIKITDVFQQSLIEVSDSNLALHLIYICHFSVFIINTSNLNCRFFMPTYQKHVVTLSTKAVY